MGDGPYKIVFRSEARDDLNREYRYSKQQWGADHARKHFADLRANIANLATLPMHHAAIGGRKSEWRRISTIGGLKVAYRIDEKARTIEVYAIVGRNRFHEVEEMIRRRRAVKKR
jgi:plasmid stabilization system protein ParE